MSHVHPASVHEGQAAYAALTVLLETGSPAQLEMLASIPGLPGSIVDQLVDTATGAVLDWTIEIQALSPGQQRRLIRRVQASQFLLHDGAVLGLAERHDLVPDVGWEIWRMIRYRTGLSLDFSPIAHALAVSPATSLDLLADIADHSPLPHIGHEAFTALSERPRDAWAALSPSALSAFLSWPLSRTVREIVMLRATGAGFAESAG